ncbi:hypothetical protein BDW75DRAFT_226121, partial [Aspergillus navahoensis]
MTEVAANEDTAGANTSVDNSATANIDSDTNTRAGVAPDDTDHADSQADMPMTEVAANEDTAGANTSVDNSATANIDSDTNTRAGVAPDDTGHPGAQADTPLTDAGANADVDAEVDAESDDSRSSFEPPPAALLYRATGDGRRNFRPVAVKGQKSWNALKQVKSASLGTWDIKLYDIVTVCQGRSEGYAKVTDLRDLKDGRFMVVYTWLYTREEISEEYTGNNGVSLHLQENLEQRWPETAEFGYMLSSNRTVTLWDTAICRAPEEVASRICDSFVYLTTPSKNITRNRWIYSVKDPRVRWLANILSK